MALPREGVHCLRSQAADPGDYRRSLWQVLLVPIGGSYAELTGGWHGPARLWLLHAPRPSLLTVLVGGALRAVAEIPADVGPPIRRAGVPPVATGAVGEGWSGKNEGEDGSQQKSPRSMVPRGRPK